MQNDETLIEYLQPGNGESKQGYFWTLKQPGSDAVLFWRNSRSAQPLSTIIPADFSCTVGCDGYSVDQSRVAASDERIRLAACLAHMLRKKDKAKADHARPAANVLQLNQQLYSTEKQLRQSKGGAKKRHIPRSSHSRMIVERIGALLRQWEKEERFRPQSLMGKAID